MNEETIYTMILGTLLALIAAWAPSPLVLLHPREARLRFFSAPAPAFRPEIHPAAVPSGRALTGDSASRRRTPFPKFGRNPRPAQAERPPDSIPRPT
jgi:hypothetical protein